MPEICVCQIISTSMPLKFHRTVVWNLIAPTRKMSCGIVLFQIKFYVRFAIAESIMQNAAVVVIGRYFPGRLLWDKLLRVTNDRF